jgi:hypothetical protein
MSTEVATMPEVEAQPVEEVADIFPDSAIEAAAVASSPEETESEVESESEEENSVASSTTSDATSTPEAMSDWIDTVEKIEYHFRKDEAEQDRSFNFFQDSKGNALRIVEFYNGSSPYLLINDSMIMKRDEFLRINEVTYDSESNSSTLNVKYSGPRVINNVTPGLIAEALMVFGDDADSDNSSDTSSDASSDNSSEEEPEVSPEPVAPAHKNTESQQSVINFLSTFFIAILLLKIVKFTTSF